MRILHVVPSYLPATRYGGPIYSVHGLCRALAGLGHEVHVVTTNVDGSGDSVVPLGDAITLDGVKVWYFHSRVLRRIYYSPEMMRHLKKQMPSFDLVHLHSVFLWPTWATARVARSAGVPYVLSPRGMLVKALIQRKSRWIKTAWIRLIEARNIEKAAAVHVTSGKEAEELRGFGFRLPEVWNLPNGVDLPQSWSRADVSEDVQKAIGQGGYVLFLGRINWKKGLDRLIRAWREVKGTRLLIAGNDEEGYLPELQRHVEECGVGLAVTFLARSVSGADKEALFAGARFFVLPSYSENFGNTVLEALIRGIPVVATEEVGAGEVVRQCGGGLVIPADKLAQTFSDLVLDLSGLESMGKQGAAWVKAHYTWPEIASTMAEHYRRVVHA
ncbi:MAG TPA: hypothetical protein DDY20_08815 [Desulfobulbaceae bacterium]|nr:hypothetical protein [Desulfobulbaceae bacterium]